MRLIDADEFKAFNARWMANEKDPDKKRARETRTQLFNTFIDMQETIDAVPRIKGAWTRNSNGTYSCSLCQSWIPNEQRYYANYCLFCGADMRGDKDGNN